MRHRNNESLTRAAYAGGPSGEPQRELPRALRGKEGLEPTAAQASADENGEDSTSDGETEDAGGETYWSDIGEALVRDAIPPLHGGVDIDGNAFTLGDPLPFLNRQLTRDGAEARRGLIQQQQGHVHRHLASLWGAAANLLDTANSASSDIFTLEDDCNVRDLQRMLHDIPTAMKTDRTTCRRGPP